MKIEEFAGLFKDKMEELLRLETILPSKQDKNYNYGDWTFMFNCAVFDVIKEFNKNHNTKISLCAEPEAGKTPNGRGAYSDILICSRNKKQRYVMIEHENLENETSPKDKLQAIINKLSRSNATYKLIITYWFKELSKEQIIKELKSRISKGGCLHLLIAPWDMKSGKEYELIDVSK